MSLNTSDLEGAVTPQSAVPTAHEAVARVHRWLQRTIGTAVHTAAATFDPATSYWHVPIELAYGATGLLGVVSDVGMSMRPRVMSPGGPWLRPCASERKRWPARMAARHAGLVRPGTAVVVGRSVRTDGPRPAGQTPGAVRR